MRRSRAFDPAFYLAAYPDVAARGDDPLLHYLERGWHEGRDPSPHFSTAAYLRPRPDIGQADMNPLLHFVTHGGREDGDG